MPNVNLGDSASTLNVNLGDSASTLFAKHPLSKDAFTAAPNFQDMNTTSFAKLQKLADEATTSQAGLADAQTQAAVQQNAAQGQYAQKEADYMLAGARKAEAAQEPVPDKFAPTQENHSDMVALFSMIGAIGAMGGGKSYGSALGAMQAMGGMLQGYTKGRQDLFEREKVEFDKNLQAVKAHNDQINAAFDRYMKMAPANLTAAKNELNTKLVSIGANLQAKQVEMSGAQQAFENQLKVTQELAKVTTAANKLTGTGGSGTVNIIGPDGKPIVITKKQAVEAAQEGKPYTPANKLTEGSAAIDDATAKLLAEQFISGRTQALAGLGSGASGAANRSKVLNMISQIAQEKGYSGADLAAKAQEYMGLGAEMRAAGTASAKVGMAATETNRLFQPAIETSKKVSRFNFVPANKLLQMAEENISDPDLAKFKTATKAVINTYIKVMSPFGVPSDFVRKHAYDLLETADSQEKYEAVIDQMKLEINAAVAAPEDFIRSRLNQWKGLKEPPASFPRGDDPGEAVAPKPSAASGGGKPTLQQFLEKAKASNPGSSDQELTDYYNKKYGSQ